MLSPAQTAAGIPAHPLPMPRWDTIHHHRVWTPAHRRIICNWRLQNKLSPRCERFSQGILIDFFFFSFWEGPEMDTGRLYHGYKNGKSFQILATVQEVKGMGMLGLLSMLCSAAGLR